MARKSVGLYRPKGLEDYLAGRRYYTDADIGLIIVAVGKLPRGKVDLAVPDPETGDLKTKRVARSEALQYRLERCVHWWAIQVETQKTPTHKQLEKEYARIESAAKRLLSTLHISENGKVVNIPDAVRYGGLQAYAAVEAEKLGGFPEYLGEDLLQQSVAGVARLRRWAEAAGERERVSAAQATALADRATVTGWKRDEGVRYLIDHLKKDLGREPHIEEIRTAAKRENMPLPLVKMSSAIRVPGHTADEALNTLFRNLTEIWIEVLNGLPRTSVGKPESTKAGQPVGPFVRFIQACLEPLPIKLTDEAVRERVRVLFQDKGMGKLRRRKL